MLLVSEKMGGGEEEKRLNKNWVEREKAYKELLWVKNSFAVCAGGAGESQVSSSHGTCGWGGRASRNENQDDGEGRDKDQFDEGDMNNKETGVAGGLKASYTGILRPHTLVA
jgi:hypothetical protein